MKKEIKRTIPYLLMLVIGFNTHNFAMSDNIPSKIAVVDVNTVLSKSVQFMALKKEQENKKDQLEKWISKAKTDVEKQTTDEEKMKLAKKYDEELLKKQKVIQEDYTNKLRNIDKSISAVLAQEAKNKGYDIVLPKSTVLYGGDDITASITKLVK